MAVVLTASGGVLGADLVAGKPQIKAGDVIVVLDDPHVQAGTEKLAPARAGTQLVATHVNGNWVALGESRRK